MKCSNCGFENDSGYKFCGRCGNQLDVNEPKVLRLKCQNCNGVMDVDEDKMIAFCPYCGSKNLIIESDVVKVEKIRSQTKITKEQIHRDQAITEKELELKKEKQDFKMGMIGSLSFLLLTLLISFAMFGFDSCSNKAAPLPVTMQEQP